MYQKTHVVNSNGRIECELHCAFACEPNQERGREFCLPLSQACAAHTQHKLLQYTPQIQEPETKVPERIH